MTIKVEQEALLRVLESQSTVYQQQQPSSSESKPAREDLLRLDCRRALTARFAAVESVLKSTSEDDDSVYTLSTASLSDDEPDVGRSVCFAPELVTEVWTRPFTPKEEIPNLFYSTEETQRFRHEYRMEKKLMSELSIDPDSCPGESEELSELVSASCQPNNSGRHRISRVVVLHNDKLETFHNSEDTIVSASVNQGDCFFDNDSFWSGSITWY